MKKFKLIASYYENEQDWQKIVCENEIKNVANIYEENVIYEILNVPITEIDKLNTELKKYTDKTGEWITEEEELLDFVKSFCSEADISLLPVFPNSEEKLCYDANFEHEFFNLLIVDTIEMYEWYDGRNWKKEFIDTVIDLTVTDTSINLDEWDGRNMTTGGLGYHERVYKILEINDESQDDMYLVYNYTQWQGEHDTGKVFTNTELESYLKEIDRDVEKYMKEIEKL